MGVVFFRFTFHHKLRKEEGGEAFINGGTIDLFDSKNIIIIV